jgi:hypothetical protein
VVIVGDFSIQRTLASTLAHRALQVCDGQRFQERRIPIEHKRSFLGVSADIMERAHTSVARLFGRSSSFGISASGDPHLVRYPVFHPFRKLTQRGL